MGKLAFKDVPYGEFLQDYLNAKNPIDRCSYDLSFTLKNIGFDELTDGYFFIGDENTRYMEKFKNSFSLKRIGNPMLSYANLYLYSKLGLFVIADLDRTSSLFRYFILKVVGIKTYSISDNRIVDELDVMQITKSSKFFPTASCAIDRGLIYLTKLFEKWKKKNSRQK